MEPLSGMKGSHTSQHALASHAVNEEYILKDEGTHAVLTGELI